MATIEAQAVAEPAADERPVNEGKSQAAFEKGQALAAEGDIPNAIAALREAVDHNPDHLEATFRLAYLLDLRGDDDGALELYESLAARPNPTCNALLNLAVVYEDRGRYELAVRCCRRVLNTNPKRNTGHPQVSTTAPERRIPGTCLLWFSQTSSGYFVRSLIVL